MRTSCNGCRVLRKGCSEDCAIRPSVEWIKPPDSQANATVFLAKFYGRAGLLNLLSAAPPNLRPAIFKSLLYEACGRIVDPVYGSAGLMWSGQWHHCQAAVDAVLKGLPIHQLQGPTPMPPPPGDNVHVIIPPPSLRDIRHVSSKTNGPGPAAHSDDLISMFSTQTVEPTVSDRADPDSVDPDAGLELTLGFGRGL